MPDLDLDLEALKRDLTGMDRCDPGHKGIWDPEARAGGLDWPSTAVTMIGMKRMDNLQMCTESVLADGVPGDFIETGVWRGGVCIFMRAVLAAHHVTDRIVWAADSFRGFPPGDPGGVDLTVYPELVVSLAEVRENFRKYGMLDEQVRFLPGWFSEMLPGPVGMLAVLRLDGDYGSSTRYALEALYPKLSPGGYLIVDDWNFPDCRQAVNDYRAGHGITGEITGIDSMSVFWRRDAG